MGVIQNQLKTVILLALLTALLLWVGQLIGGTTGLFIGLTFAIIMNFGSYWFSDKIVLFMYRAKKVSKKEAPQLYEAVKEVSEKAQLPMPKVYIIPTQTPNAFATGRNPKHAAVAATAGILELLTKEELKGVIAHEMAHVKNRDILITTIAATIAGVISYISQFAIFFGGRDDDNNGLQLLVLAILTPIIATIIQLAISRSREYMADETGARTIHDSKSLASALKKLEEGVKAHPLGFGNASTSSLFITNPFNAKGIINLFSTHPPIEERVKRLKEMRL